MQRVVTLVFFLSAALAVAGCGGTPAPPKQVAIEGKLTVGGSPIEAAEMALHPQDTKQGAWTAIVSGGTYTASVPPGSYKVTVMPLPSDEGPPVRLDAIYADRAKTPLSIAVGANPASGAFDLDLK